ncbi:hypothetical protein L6258_00195, partial [Candidatus Parcubacteria bacterium]|nr:hypothetical protein [Candidatus Parcubacteria bacterium]
MKIVKSVQEAINAVDDGAVGVYRDTYMDQICPDYPVLETAWELDKFRRLVAAVQEAPRGTLAVSDALEELREFVDRPCLPGFLHVLYDEEKGWRQSPESLLDDEFDRLQEEEDGEWFDNQREHFAEKEDPAPVVSDEPWRKKVITVATEIAAMEDRGPEEGDFNTAMILLHEEVPRKELAFLQRDLMAIEMGTSSDSLDRIGDNPPVHQPFCDGCGFVFDDCICHELFVCPHCRA